MGKNQETTAITVKEAKEKIKSFCAYQERTQNEVRQKLYSYGLSSTSVEEILADLITENFVNEERFAITYAGGKFRMKKWGKLKIASALKAKGISGYCLNEALKAIDNEDYQKMLVDILQKKNVSLEEGNPYKRKDILARHAIAKGYEPNLVWEAISDLLD